MELFENMLDMAEEMKKRRGSYRGGVPRMPDNEVRMGINKKKTDGRPRCTVVIGPEVAADLLLQAEDKVDIKFNERVLYIRRNPNGHYRLKSEGSHGALIVHFSIQAGKYSDVTGLVSRKRKDYFFFEDGLAIHW